VVRAGEGYDASFHTKAWMDARFAEVDAPKESYEEYKKRIAKEEEKEREKERTLEEAEGVLDMALHAAATSNLSRCTIVEVCSQPMVAMVTPIHCTEVL
jgi:hypothetical protein